MAIGHRLLAARLKKTVKPCAAISLWNRKEVAYVDGMIATGYRRKRGVT